MTTKSVGKMREDETATLPLPPINSPLDKSMQREEIANTEHKPAPPPHLFFRFLSNLVSSTSCRLYDCVWALKFTVAFTNLGSGPVVMRSRASLMMTLLPTPVSPANSTLRPEAMMVLIMYAYRVVSTVGTRMLKYASCTAPTIAPRCSTHSS